uniref:Uncharacterized protein n=1 Tax=Cebus imitator TaxID=2715852 RepID=A0A2K5QGM4_CEBIM
MFLRLDSHSSLERTKPSVVRVDTHMELDVHGCPERDWGGGFTKGPMLPGLQGEDKPAPIPKPTLPSPSCLTLFISSSQIEDHGFPARKNGLTQLSFIYQVPVGWGSPSCRFLPFPPVRTPVVLKPPPPPCPISWGKPGPAVDGIRRTPAPG